MRSRLLPVGASVLLVVGLATGCTSTSSAPAPVAPTQDSDAPTLPSLQPSAPPEGGGIALGPGSDLPEQWPADLPSFADGQLMSAVVSADQLAINAAWATDLALAEAFGAMEAALLANGFLPTSQTGGEDMLIEAGDLTSNDYSSAAFDVNLTVVTAGDQSTVMLNASRR